MKLKNKKTGVIGDLVAYDADKGIFAVKAQGGDRCYYYSLAALYEVWEDVPEEPKGFWYINDQGFVGEYPTSLLDRDGIIGNFKRFGNYFETKEEAEKAVERLRAWKRLKDRGFRFVGWDKALRRQEPCKSVVFCDFDDLIKSEKDLDLLFCTEVKNEQIY